MKYTVGMGSGAIMYVLNVIGIGSVIQKYTERNHIDRDSIMISHHSFNSLNALWQDALMMKFWSQQWWLLLGNGFLS
jgi:hypothetical protein